MNHRKDMIGKIFGRLRVVAFTHSNEDKKLCYDCKCTCGKSINTTGKRLRAGNTKSCGCLAKETRGKNLITHGNYSKNINKAEYNCWYNMIDRCTNSKNAAYNNYGGRGIRVSPEWSYDFKNFFADMGKKPTPKHTLERIENEKGYSKENCRWAMWTEQQNNRRTNRFIEYNGKSQTVAQWAVELGLTWEGLHRRLKAWPVDKALSTKKIFQ